MSRSAFELETAYLKNLLNKIVDKLNKLELDLKRTDQDKDDIQRNFYKDVRLNSSTYSGLMDTSVSIRQQQQLISERENRSYKSQRQKKILQKMKLNPYFARLDLIEGDSKKVEKIYIGLGSFSDQNDNFLVYDWRSPIASVYYESSLGELTYESPVGEKKVNVSLKRQFTFEERPIKIFLRYRRSY